MLKKIIGAALAAAMFLSVVPNVPAAELALSYGFEAKEDDWVREATNGRTASGYDEYKSHSGSRSYKFEAVTSTSDASELSAISKKIDVEYGGAYKIGIWYLLSEDYTRLDGSEGGAFFSYTLIDANGMEIADTSYTYYISSVSYEDDVYTEHWAGNDFYVIPTKSTASIKITIGLKAATGQVNFDDITVDEISMSEVLSNPTTQSQSSSDLIRDSYFVGFESDETFWWKLTTASEAMAVCGITTDDAHSGSSCYRFKADTMNVTANNNQTLVNSNYNGTYFMVNPGVYQVSWWYKIEGPYQRASSSWGMSVTGSSYTEEGTENTTGKISKTYLVTDADRGWQQSVYTITVPEGSNRIRINIGLRASTGTFMIDDIEITPLVTDLVTTPDLENYHGMSVRKIDSDSVFINIDTEEALSSDVIDYCVFGDEESEAAHDLDPGNSVTGVGGLGEDTFRQLYPGDDELWVTMKVDPEKMNYVTVKLWGSEYENKQTETLMINDEYGTIQSKYGTVWPVWDYMYEEPAQRDSYFYETYRLPMAMTYGKTEVRLQITHYGPYSAYSANGFAESTEYSRQMYQLVTHTDPDYAKLETDKETTTKRYDLGAIKVSPNGLSPYDYIINEMNASIEEILKSQNYGPQWEEAVAAGRSPVEATGACLEGTNSYNLGTWENWKSTHYSKCIGSNGENIKGFRAAAMAYNREWSNYYHDPEIVDRAVAWLDYYVRAQGSDGGWQNKTYQTWIGGPDRMESDFEMEAGERAIGEVFLELYEPIVEMGYLDEYIDDDLDPDTPEVKRKDAYANMYYKASDKVFNGMTRRTSVNQDLFCVVSGTSFELALEKLDPSKCMDRDTLKWWWYTASGILVAPHDSIQISPKGLSMEIHGHLNGAYDGNYGPHGAALVTDLALMTGDEQLIDKALHAQNALTYFEETIQNHENYVAIRREYNINTRNYKGPGLVEYAAWNSFAAASLGSKDSIRSMELFIEYGELYLSSLVDDRRLLYYMMLNFDALGDEIKEASEGYTTYADIGGIEQEAAIVTLAWKGIIEGVNETNFAPDEKIDEETFKRWLMNAFGNDTEIAYNDVMSRAQAAYEIYYKLLDNGVYITKFDLGSGIYLPNEPWNTDADGNQAEYAFCDEYAETIAFCHNNAIVRMTLNWRSDYDQSSYEARSREHATTSQAIRWHEMNDGYSQAGNGYMTSPLGLRRVDIAKYGQYVIIMNCSDEDKSVNITFNADVDKAYDLVSEEYIELNGEMTLPAQTTIILDLKMTE